MTPEPSETPSTEPTQPTTTPEPAPTVTETVTVTETAVPTGPSEVVLTETQFVPLLFVAGIVLLLVAFIAVLSVRRG